MIIVEFQRGDTGGIGLESEHEDIAHESHVLGDVLGDAVGRALYIGFGERGAPALEFALFPALFDPGFYIAD
ncbi:MAG: hypothetical protein RI897_906 [Verrucomicrobiota bacterium]